MQKNKLLVLSNGFPEIYTERYHCQFVYEQTRLVTSLFSMISVISPQPYLPPFLRTIPQLSGYAKLSGFHDYKIQNLSIYYPTYLTLPLPYFQEHNNIPMARAIHQSLRSSDISYDIAHVHFLYPTGEAALSIIPSTVHKILSLHGGDLYKWATLPINRARAQATLRAYDRLHVPSQYLARVLQALDPTLDPKRIYIIPPAIDTTLFSQKEKKQGDPIILMVANLVPEKGHEDALLAFAALLKQVPQAKLKIVGTGPLYSQLSTKIKILQLTHSVELVGSIAHHDLPKWYHAASLLLFPSYAESFGIVQIEAMACGTPVVAYDNEGSKEIFAAHPDYLVKVGNIPDLVKKMQLTLLHPPSSQKLQTIVEPYREHVVAKKLAALYRFS